MRRAVLLTLPLLALGVMAGPVAAEPEGPDTARLDRIAAWLERTPVFVDPEYFDVLAPDKREILRARLARLDVPVHILVLPLFQMDESGGRPELLVQNLHERTGKNGIYVVVSNVEGPWVQNYGVPLKVRTGPPDPDEGESSSALEALNEVLDDIERAPPGPPGTPEKLPPIARWLNVHHRGRTEPRNEGLLDGVLFGGPLVALGLFGSSVYVARRLSGRQLGETPEETAAELGESELRDLAEGEIAALSETVEQAQRTETEQTSRERAAVDCLDAALLVAQRAETSSDWLCAALFAVQGRAELDATTPGKATLCEIDPLHGQADENNRVRLPGRPRLRVRACRQCRCRPATERRVLRIRSRDEDAAVPYYWADEILGGLKGPDLRGLTRRIREEFHVA